MTLALAVLAALFSLATALASVLGRREAAQEARALRRELAAMAERLQAAERASERATARAEAAGRQLLEKGVASEAEVDRARDLERPQVAPTPRGGPRTVH